MFTLKYYNSEEEKQPEHNSNICYYVLKGDNQYHTSLEQQFAEATYGWYSDCGEVDEYFEEDKESHFKIGDTRKATWYEKGDRESHEYVRLHLCLDGQPLWRNLEDDIAVIAWNYTHDIKYEVSKYLVDEDYFPCFDINNLLREGFVKVVEYKKRLIENLNDATQNYYQVYALVLYKENYYNLSMSQDSLWEDTDWTEEGGYGKVSVFRWEKL